jgi:hypothetical protein
MRVNVRVTKGMALAVTFLALVLLTACSRSSDNNVSDTTSGGSYHPTAVLIRGGGPDPDSLDPQRARSVE